MALSSRRINLQIASCQFRPSPWTPPAIEGKITTMICSRCDCHEPNRIFGGAFMNGSTGSGRCKGLASLAMLMGALFTILLHPAYAQQDVAPSWYDPWAAPQALVAHPAQAPAVVHSTPPLAPHRLQTAEKVLAPAPHTKLRLKETHLDPGVHNVAYKRGETPSGN
jgi:hypothetical protein